MPLAQSSLEVSIFVARDEVGFVHPVAGARFGRIVVVLLRCYRDATDVLAQRCHLAVRHRGARSIAMFLTAVYIEETPKTWQYSEVGEVGLVHTDGVLEKARDVAFDKVARK